MISAISPPVPFVERVHSIVIDFGYTYSGYAICNKGGLTHFMAKNGEPLCKEESCLIYHRSDKASHRWDVYLAGSKAFDARLRIKNNCMADFVFVSGLKERVDSYIPATDHATSLEEPDLLQILSDYFTHLKNMALNDCVKRFGSATFDPTLVQWVLSISNTWTHHQKHLIRLACFEAGLTEMASSDTLVLCGDAEAALVSASDGGSFGVGDLVTVCDCGGSKTTISTFKVLPANSYMPVTKPTIVNIGSDSIDQELLSRFKAHVGHQVFDDWMQQVPQLGSRIEAQFKVLKQFFNLKKNSTDSCKKIRILNQDVMLFTISEFKEIMSTVVEEIVQGLECQLNTIPTKSGNKNRRVIVVGGFARSIVLTKRLSELLGEALLLPREPSKSILDGLLHLATKPNGIKDRASRFSYGTQFSKIFDPKIDDPTAYRWGSPPNEFIAAFLPFTKAGTPIPSEKVFEQIVCPANDHQTEFPFGLYYSMLSCPVLADCIELVTLTVAIPDTYRHLGRENRFRILMVFGITEIKFSVVHTQSGETHESVVVL